MESSPGVPSKLATAAGGLGCAALLLAAGGPLLIHLGAFAPMTGFSCFGLGLLLGLGALLLGLVGLWLTRPASGRGGRGRALLGAGAGALLLLLVFLATRSSGDLPPVNDITTDPDDPPAFTAALEIPANRDRDMGYAGGELAAVTRAAYPDLATLQVGRPPATVLADAERVARELGWEVTHADPATGSLEATHTSAVFRFVDDVVVRIRPAAGGRASEVDLRSKSRDGRGDIGANAARIRAFRDAL